LSNFGSRLQYGDLYLQLEDTLNTIIKSDRSDAHSRNERGWTPPPKQYVERVEETAVEE
jgi:hypothetical protein